MDRVDELPCGCVVLVRINDSHSKMVYAFDRQCRECLQLPEQDLLCHLNDQYYASEVMATTARAWWGI